eukprot:TRINITY_DN8176_c0_g1_i4.p1 TRINITY_DN8176_c0_g1~~TRINITY_DN8176_c0_g1_i4.p1  ORF type:complete len:201 (-),score=-3.25 TRINITY_DN8176_c0_g1_i4:8-610(-)
MSACRYACLDLGMEGMKSSQLSHGAGRNTGNNMGMHAIHAPTQKNYPIYRMLQSSLAKQLFSHRMQSGGGQEWRPSCCVSADRLARSQEFIKMARAWHNESSMESHAHGQGAQAEASKLSAKLNLRAERPNTRKLSVDRTSGQRAKQVYMQYMQHDAQSCKIQVQRREKRVLSIEESRGTRQQKQHYSTKKLLQSEKRRS